MGDAELVVGEKPIEEKPIEEPVEEKPIEVRPVELTQLTVSVNEPLWKEMKPEPKSEYAVTLVDGALTEKNSVKEQLNALIREEELAYWALQREYEQKRRELERKYAELKEKVVSNG